MAARVLGSLASVMGLISLTKPSLSQRDLENLEISSLQKIAAATHDIRELEEERLARREEIATLEQ